MPLPATTPLPHHAETIVAEMLREDRRIMVVGPMGSGKSTLVGEITRILDDAGRPCPCISADPGTPAFGPPGAVALGLPGPEGWQVRSIEPLCTLDAVRFRLPLVEAVRRLATGTDSPLLLLDPPGVVRGPAAGELLAALVSAASIDLLLVLAPRGRPFALSADLDALALERSLIEPDPGAHRPGPQSRSRTRTAAWDLWLENGVRQRLALDRVLVIGTPPPADLSSAWAGRQIAVIGREDTATIGEIEARQGDNLLVRLPIPIAQPLRALVRDACRGADGQLATAARFAAESVGYLPSAVRSAPADGGPCPVARVGAMDAILVNGVFGDPLLHVRIRHLGRSLLLDLGEGARLSARLAHQVTDCFISHAHMDHLSGFIWLLRSRLGELPPCRLHGPPGLADHVHSLIRGFLWDRIGDCGPAFEINELHGDRLRRFSTQAGRNGLQARGSVPAPDGLMLQEEGLRVRAVTLDHGTPVLAFALEPPDELHLRKDRLQARALASGPWVRRLKSALRRGELDAPMVLPDGSRATAAELGRDLILTTPGKRLIYATDLGDSPANRDRLVALARNAHTLFLEATYTEADRDRAEANGHLTARACGEIAEAAGVSRLVPLHLSRRYQCDPSNLLDELKAACPRVVLPRMQPGAE